MADNMPASPHRRTSEPPLEAWAVSSPPCMSPPHSKDNPLMDIVGRRTLDAVLSEAGLTD